MSSESDRRPLLRIGSLIGGLIGLGLAGWMLGSYGVARTLRVLAHAGWLGTLAIIGFHLLQMVLSALGWRAIAVSGGARPRLRAYLVLRWVREAVNNLLPLAQVGGELVAARLLERRGVQLGAAVSGTIADLLMEMATQIVFALLGLVLLLNITGQSEISAFVAKGLLVATGMLLAGFAALGLGWTATLESGLKRLGSIFGWPAATRISGLHDALKGCYGSPGRVASSAVWHLLSWVLGGVEVWLILHFFGVSLGIGPALIIESLGQASKALGFAIPGALGVQEGGYLVVCSTLGLSPELGIALSLMKRVREVAWGVAGLALWQRAEGQDAVTAATSLSGSTR